MYVWLGPVQKPLPTVWMGVQSPTGIKDAARRGYNVAHVAVSMG